MMPEILDADLCSLVLTSAAWGALGREDLPWMTPPPASNWDQAVGLLKMLGALDGDGHLTKKGVSMAKLPMHPRLANMVIGDGRVEHVDRAEGVGVASLLAAIVEEGNRSRETDIRKIAEEIKETPNRPFSKRVLQLARRFSFNAERQSSREAEMVVSGALPQTPKDSASLRLCDSALKLDCSALKPNLRAN